MKKIWVVFAVFCLALGFVPPCLATMIDVLPGTAADVSGVRVEFYDPLLDLTHDVTEQDWSRNDLWGLGQSLDFYFSDLTDYISIDVYTLGDTLVTDGGCFWFYSYDALGALLDSEVACVQFGQRPNFVFTSIEPVISHLELHFSDSDAGGFVDSLQYNMVVPEPATMFMFGVGMAVLLGLNFRKKRKPA